MQKLAHFCPAALVWQSVWFLWSEVTQWSQPEGAWEGYHPEARPPAQARLEQGLRKKSQLTICRRLLPDSLRASDLSLLLRQDHKSFDEQSQLTVWSLIHPWMEGCFSSYFKKWVKSDRPWVCLLWYHLLARKGRVSLFSLKWRQVFTRTCALIDVTSSLLPLGELERHALRVFIRRNAKFLISLCMCLVLRAYLNYQLNGTEASPVEILFGTSLVQLIYVTFLPWNGLSHEPTVIDALPFYPSGVRQLPPSLPSLALLTAILLVSLNQSE